MESFWTFWGDKVHTYFAEAYGAAIVRTAARFLWPGQLCVDYGCGSGGLTAALLNAGFRVAAIDYSPKSVEDVTARFSEHDLFTGARRVADLATAGGDPADALFSVETIEHILPQHEADYFRNLRGLLKPGGTAFLSTPNNEDIEAAKVFCPEAGAVFHPMQHARSFDTQSLPRLLSENGFRPSETYVTDFGLLLREPPKQWVADKGKRMLGMGMPPPHLVRIAKLAG